MKKSLKMLFVVTCLGLGVAACKKVDPSVEYQTFKTWNEAQSQVQTTATAAFQQQFQAALSSKDPKAVSAAIEQYAGKIDEALKSLEQLKVENDEIKVLVEKHKQFFQSSANLLRDQAKAIVTGTPEMQQKIVEGTEKVNKILKETEEVQTQLQQKYGKPAEKAAAK